MGPTQKSHVSDCVDTPPVATRTYFLEKNSEKAHGGGTLKGTRPPAAAGGLWRPPRRRGGPWRGVSKSPMGTGIRQPRFV